MIAIDTNVLLWDDNAQAEKAARLVGGSTPVLITDVVLATPWWNAWPVS